MGSALQGKNFLLEQQKMDLKFTSEKLQKKNNEIKNK